MVPGISLQLFNSHKGHECYKKLFQASLEFLRLQDLRIIQ